MYKSVFRFNVYKCRAYGREGLTALSTSFSTITRESRMETLTLEKESGFRFTVKDSLSLQLEFGSAEILGSELKPKMDYAFRSGSKVVLFTWHGCTLNLKGHFSSEAFTSNSTTGRYLFIHNSLNQMREESKSRFSRGPRILVVGPTDMGKSSLCKVLCNYAVRSGWRPVFVDLDLGQNEISLPGTIGATIITEQTNIERGITSVPFKISHFGFKTPDRNGSHYKFLIGNMAKSVTRLQCEDQKSNFSGIIINTCGWVTGFGYETIVTAAHAFEVDVVIVMGNEFLYLSLKKDLPSFVRVIMLPKPEEVVPRSKAMRVEKRASVVRNYFRGIQGELISFQMRVPFKDIRIFRIQKQSNRRPFAAVPVDIDVSLERHAASVSCFDPRSEEFLHETVSDFVIILGVDMRENYITILTRDPSQKLGYLLLMDDVQYYD